MQKKYTYLIQDSITKFYKIGTSKNDPKKRLKQLQTGASGSLSLIGYLEEDRQKQLHWRFNSLKIREQNEWFVNSIVIFNAFKDLKSFEQEYNNLKNKDKEQKNVEG